MNTRITSSAHLTNHQRMSTMTEPEEVFESLARDELLDVELVPYPDEDDDEREDWRALPTSQNIDCCAYIASTRRV